MADGIEDVMQVVARAMSSVNLALENIPKCEAWWLDIRGLTGRKCIGMNPPTAVLPGFQ
jgi:hypothetical protein